MNGVPLNLLILSAAGWLCVVLTCLSLFDAWRRLRWWLFVIGWCCMASGLTAWGLSG